MLVAERAEPAVAALRAFRAAVFAGTPLGRPIEGTLPALKRTTLADVRAAYASFGPGSAALVAVGGADAAKVVAALRSAFGAWQGSKARPASRMPEPPAVRPRLVFVDFPGKPQSVLVVGQPTAPRSSPDHLALEVLNAVGGGSFTSRLNQNLREQHGYSYGASSRFEWGLGRSPFTARSSVKTDVSGPALSELLGELRRAADQPLDPAELDKGRALLAYRLVDTLSHASQLAAAVAQIWLYSLPLDEYRTYVPRLQALSVESIQAAAHRTLQPAQMTVAVAGDKAVVLPQLAPLSLGTPELRDPAGDRLP
jgi:zinc protease